MRLAAQHGLPAICPFAEKLPRRIADILQVGTPEALAGAFDVMQRERAQALIVPSSPFHKNLRGQIAELAAQHRLPSMFSGRAFVDRFELIVNQKTAKTIGVNITLSVLARADEVIQQGAGNTS